MLPLRCLVAVSASYSRARDVKEPVRRGTGKNVVVALLNERYVGDVARVAASAEGSRCLQAMVREAA